MRRALTSILILSATFFLLLHLIQGFRRGIQDYLILVEGFPPRPAPNQSAIVDLQSVLVRILRNQKHPIFTSLPYLPEILYPRIDQRSFDETAGERSGRAKICDNIKKIPLGS